MSTVEEKNKQSFKKLILIRQASLDKIKCSAYSTIGSIFSEKSSLIYILENAMNSSRTFVQIPVLTIIIPSVHFICVAMSILINLIRKKYSGGMSFENLDKFIFELNQLKLERKQSIQRLKQKQEETDKPVDVKIKSTEGTFERHEQDKVFHDADIVIVKKRDNLLAIASFVSIAFVYTQMTLLLLIIFGMSAMKLGLLFMLICIAALAYFTLKISFTIKLSERHRNSRQLKSVRHKLSGKALTLRQITCVLPQIIFNSCGSSGKFSMWNKSKSS
ncbi:hypothetical protein PVAND_007759 [Polypedilum vanderplanki]|uniref:Uncharacterized protein n=1 Tax=Polypedilum vanderplanki TaxID=319348 RepID=A0A9J6C871_POLVA|nr:hypothetical protein PVAND_007759 [Polypedilum vanderplanki]